MTGISKTEWQHGGYRQVTLLAKDPDLSNIFPLLLYIEMKGNTTSSSSFTYNGLFLLGAIEHALQQ